MQEAKVKLKKWLHAVGEGGRGREGEKVGEGGRGWRGWERVGVGGRG